MNHQDTKEHQEHKELFQLGAIGVLGVLVVISPSLRDDGKARWQGDDFRAGGDFFGGGTGR
ncbi:MAG: hypothetical protein ABR525_11195, partial [Candidatus Limnocylindria bacterium]